MKNQLTASNVGARLRPINTFGAALLPALLLLTITISQAGSAKWRPNPASGDWNVATNWQAAMAPGGSGENPPVHVTFTFYPAAEEHGAIIRGSDGALWFPLYPNGIGRMTTAGVFTQYSTPFAPGNAIASGPDGALWFNDLQTDQFGNDYLGRITTAGVVTAYLLPRHPSPVGGIAAGPDHAMWFTEPVSYGNGYIGRISTTGVITEHLLPTQYVYPEHITLGRDGALWFTGEVPDPGIARITTTGIVTEFPGPGTCCFAFAGIVWGPDDNLWVADYGFARIWRVTPDGTYTQYPVPSMALPSCIIRGPDQALWFTEGLGNNGNFQIGRITTSGVFTEYEPPSDGYTALCLALGPDRAIWFTDYSSVSLDRIGRFGR